MMSSDNQADGSSAGFSLFSQLIFGFAAGVLFREYLGKKDRAVFRYYRRKGEAQSYAETYPVIKEGQDTVPALVEAVTELSKHLAIPALSFGLGVFATEYLNRLKSRKLVNETYANIDKIDATLETLWKLRAFKKNSGVLSYASNAVKWGGDTVLSFLAGVLGLGSSGTTIKATIDAVTVPVAAAIAYNAALEHVKSRIPSFDRLVTARQVKVPALTSFNPLADTPEDAVRRAVGKPKQVKSDPLAGTTLEEMFSAVDAEVNADAKTKRRDTQESGHHQTG